MGQATPQAGKISIAFELVEIRKMTEHENNVCTIIQLKKK